MNMVRLIGIFGQICLMFNNVNNLDGQFLRGFGLCKPNSNLQEVHDRENAGTVFKHVLLS
jgi:hypothetical protein